MPETELARRSDEGICLFPSSPLISDSLISEVTYKPLSLWKQKRALILWPVEAHTRPPTHTNEASTPAFRVIKRDRDLIPDHCLYPVTNGHETNHKERGGADWGPGKHCHARAPKARSHGNREAAVFAILVLAPGTSQQLPHSGTRQGHRPAGAQGAANLISVVSRWQLRASFVRDSPSCSCADPLPRPLRPRAAVPTPVQLPAEAAGSVVGEGGASPRSPLASRTRTCPVPYSPNRGATAFSGPTLACLLTVVPAAAASDTGTVSSGQ